MGDFLEKIVVHPLLKEPNEIVAIMAASKISASNLNYKVDGLVKSLIFAFIVIPAKAGIQ